MQDLTFNNKDELLKFMEMHKNYKKSVRKEKCPKCKVGWVYRVYNKGYWTRCPICEKKGGG